MQEQAVPVKQPLLSDAQRQAIHEGALRLLERVGLAVDSESLRRQLARHAGVRLSQKRVCFDGQLLEELLARPAPLPWRPARDERVQLSGGCCASHIVDPETDTIRPILWADLAEATRLFDAMQSDDVSGHAPGFPQDVPPPMQALAEYLIGCLYGRAGGSFTAPCPLAAYEYYWRMCEVMGVAFSLPLYIISPLRLMGDSLEAILHYLPMVRKYSVSSMPVMGATAPIFLPAAFIQALAESFAGLAVLKLLRPDAEVHWGMMVFPLDMKYGSIVYGSPEMNLADMFRLEMEAFYGREGGSTRSIRSMSKRPDAQACIERAGSAVAGVLMGSRSFFGAGMLSVDEVFSPEMLVMDREIADYAGRFARGIDLSAEAMDIGTIGKGALAGDFMGLDSTLAHFREAYWLPRLMERRMLSGWLAGDQGNIRSRARQEIKRYLLAYDFELAPEKARALWAIYREAAQAIVGGTGLPEGVAEV